MAISSEEKTVIGDETYTSEKTHNGANSYHDETYVDSKILEEHSSDTSSEEGTYLDNRLNRKFDRRILPWVFGLWLLAFIDRSNIGNAKIDGLVSDLQLDGDKFNIALAVFYVPYIVVDVPSNWVIKYFGAGHYLPFLLISWGIVSTCTGFVKTYHSLIAVRFFLGLCEGGLLGGMIIYLAMFYRRSQLQYRIALFYCAAPLSGAIGGLLATGLAQIEYKSYRKWPWIFFVEGAITIVYGCIAIFFLPHTPQQAKFLSDEERSRAVSRMQRDSAGAAKQGSVDEESFSWHWVRLALLNVNTILLSLTFFAIITPIYSFSLFLPTIVKSLGYDQVVAQALTVPPNIGGFLTVLLTGYFSDRIRNRGYFMIAGTVIAIVGYIMLISTPKTLTEYGGTFLVAAGIFPCSPLVMGWQSNNVAPHYARATATGFQIAVANMAAFVATFTYRDEDQPRYITGHAINIAFLGMALILIVVLMLYNKWENRQREQGKRDYRLQTQDESLLGDRHPNFRYSI